MQELEKILEEIDGMIESYKENPRLEIVDICCGLNQAKRIIRKHMKTNETFEFDFSGVQSFDCQCGRHYINTAINDGWISVDERLPENNKLVLVWARSTARGADEWSLGSYDNGFWALGSYGGSLVFPSQLEAVAWHLLPEPYRVERSKQC